MTKNDFFDKYEENPPELDEDQLANLKARTSWGSEFAENYDADVISYYNWLRNHHKRCPRPSKDARIGKLEQALREIINEKGHNWKDVVFEIRRIAKKALEED